MNIHEHTVLSRAGFTERQINQHKQKFENLLNISPMYMTELEELATLREQLAAANTLIRAYREEFGKAGVSWKIDAVEPTK